mmetsp:Transcript_30423/g.58513  ORF Transcript_30423/g.58513 Transcript_30423/m.58513 type:complete len:215 (-) Transcript_30423:1923-2567(-)
MHPRSIWEPRLHGRVRHRLPLDDALVDLGQVEAQSFLHGPAAVASADNVHAPPQDGAGVTRARKGRCAHDLRLDPAIQQKVQNVKRAAAHAVGVNAAEHQDVAVLVRARGVVGEGGRARGDALAHGEGVERLPLHALCVKTVDLVQHVAVLVLAPEDPQVPGQLAHCKPRARRGRGALHVGFDPEARLEVQQTQRNVLALFLAQPTNHHNDVVH